MNFDWKKFCEQNKIHFVTSGPNTARGHISIKCPWCGNADPSQHMGLTLDKRSPTWGCMRNAKHRGSNPVVLVMVLIGVGKAHAISLVEGFGPRLDDYDKLMEEFRLANSPDEFRFKREVVGTFKAEEKALPSEFRRLTDGPYASRFIEYLGETRGFGEDVQELAEKYELYYSISGPYAWRLIFPLRAGDGRLLGWQGRDIRHGARVRYLTSAGLPEGALLAYREEDGAESVLARPHERLILVEGPLDALKLDFYGRIFGTRTVASMGTAPARARISAIRSIKARRIFVVFDSDAFSQALAFCEELPGSKWVPLPDGIKDPGEMNVAQAINFLTKIAGMS